ncbi:HD-GYP domain-containing protein [Granulicella cerasi]|nr:HD-GYP domain-containing protein [Granulicella cerasi]
MLKYSAILTSLMNALSCTEGYPEGHVLRSCIIGMRIARRVGLSPAEMQDLYYALLLKDAGSSFNSFRMSSILGFPLGSPEKTPRQLTGYSWLGLRRVLGKLHTRSRAALLLGSEAESEANRKSADIARELGMSWDTADYIYHIGERWDGRGVPDGLRGPSIPVCAQLIKLAQTLDAFRAAYGEANAMAMLQKRCVGWFDRALVRLASMLERSGVLWKQLESDDLLQMTLSLEPEPRGIDFDSSAVDHVCEAFAKIIDSYSHFTHEHSTHVMRLALSIAKVMGVASEDIATLRRAALLHDIGKLAIPVAILEKAGPLTVEERRTMEAHARLSGELLRKIPSFDSIAAVAESHHEKLDGSGYPFGKNADSLSLLSRILAVADIYEALSSSRPYRDALTPEQAMVILRTDAGTKLDARCMDALEYVVSGIKRQHEVA